MSIPDHYFKVLDAEGHPVWINDNYVVSILPALRDEPEGLKCRIVFPNGFVFYATGLPAERSEWGRRD